MDWKQISWATLLFFGGYHLFLLIGLPIYFYHMVPSLGVIISAIVLVPLTAGAVTAGYHRFYAHQAYKINKVVEVILLFFATAATQNSVLRWACDHRLHHAYTEKEQDPYNITKGFWHAHIGWMLEDNIEKRFDPKIIPDLMKNKLLLFQDKYYASSMVVSNVIIWLFVGWLFTDYIGAFMLAWWLRLFVSHHFTFFINSAAHTWGEKTYSKEQTAVDNFILAFFTMGEGYHNYHHTFARDYRNGVRWWQFDPTKWFVWSLQKVGLASGLVRMNRFTIERRLVLADKKMLLDHMKKIVHDKKIELEQKIHQLSNQLSERMTKINMLIREYQAKKKEKANVKPLRSEIKVLKKNIRRDWGEWIKLSRAVLSLTP